METNVIEKRNKYDSFTQKDMDGLKWCLKARSKDTTRPIINHILIDDGLVVATDGHRVHLFLLSELDLALKHHFKPSMSFCVKLSYLFLFSITFVSMIRFSFY